MGRLFLIVVLLAVYTVACAYGSYHVMDFGAKSDGISYSSQGTCGQERTVCFKTK